MLVLCRRTSESVQIGDEVTVTVLAVKGNQVRFGIAAPRDVSVDRQEVWERKLEEEGPAAPIVEPSSLMESPPTERTRNRRKRRTQLGLSMPPDLK